ncbi:uncharacterized protein LOC126601970 [Malus sylvestris]|uniref:uncharacterized protein LOC126601970 n=1 Tax=Malus sylvestris TaxID=3752 RepID=UPI0021AC2B20|nr:uncharacterized protein LOC126601970 [Malus sylvestris]
MAMAVQKLFPDAKVTIGPWIENGFYYDFDMEPLTDKELKRIKKEMVCKAVARLMFQLTQEPSTHLHDGYLGYDPWLSSQRFDSESLKDLAMDSPIFHGSVVDDAFATQPASEAFSPPSIYAESNGQGFDGGFGRSVLDTNSSH